jgi:adenylate cyclase class 2
MDTEIEAKFLNVDHDALRALLGKLGAAQEYPSRFMQRVNLDYPDRRLEKQSNGWLRIRDEGDKVTLTYKQVENWDSIHGTREIETTVQDFENTKNIFLTIGFEQKSYAETKREKWHLGDVEVVLDEWPWVQPFCEIEGPNEAAVKETAEKLGLDWTKALFGSVEPVYRAEYDVTDLEFYTITEFRFDAPLPELLAERKRAAEEVAV